MKRTWLSILVVFTVVVMGLYLYSDLHTVNQLNSEMNEMVYEKNYKQMKKVSANKATYLFLKSLSGTDRFNNTTDFQGGTDQNAYYVADIKKQALGVYMRKVGLINWKVAHVVKE